MLQICGHQFQIQIILSINTTKNIFMIKRSTTPAFRQKNNIAVKSTAHLKVTSQLKLQNNNGTNINKQQRRTIFTRGIVNNPSSSVLTSSNNANCYNNHSSSSINAKQQKLKTSASISKQNSNKKKDFYSEYQKYFATSSSNVNEQNNPQSIKISSLKNPQHGNLTSYLISKSWQNSSYILSPSVNQSMKKLVVQWIIQLSHYMKLKRQTLYHAMWIFQRCIQKITDLNAKNLQLLAITCLFISAKYEQIYPPHVIALIQKTMSIYHKKQVIQLEQKILVALNFQLTAPNRFTFLCMLINSNSKYLSEYDRSNDFERQNKHQQKQKQGNDQINNPNHTKRYIDFLHYILELSLLKSFAQTYSQKQIADSIIYLGSKVMNKQSLSHINKQVQKIEQDWLYLTKIQQIAYQMINLWKENKNSIVSYLYDCDKWSFVGGLTILF